MLCTLIQDALLCLNVWHLLAARKWYVLVSIPKLSLVECPCWRRFCQMPSSALNFAFLFFAGRKFTEEGGGSLWGSFKYLVDCFFCNGSQSLWLLLSLLTAPDSLHEGFQAHCWLHGLSGSSNILPFIFWWFMWSNSHFSKFLSKHFWSHSCGFIV